MFGLFKSKREKLQKKREELLKQAYDWSTLDRKKSDAFYAKADAVDLQIQGLKD